MFEFEDLVLNSQDFPPAGLSGEHSPRPLKPDHGEGSSAQEVMERLGPVYDFPLLSG